VRAEAEFFTNSSAHAAMRYVGIAGSLPVGFVYDGHRPGVWPTDHDLADAYHADAAAQSRLTPIA
jgi:hypothetical protein